jgi:Carboxypeptidase regulatory-like domain
MNLSTVLGRTIVATVFVALLSVFVLAQSPLATVSGRVLDPNGAAIIEATVTARNVDTGVTTTVQTNDVGIYHFVDLPAGNYEFSVSKKGFNVVLKPGVDLHVADNISMNFNMPVGSVSETVTITAGAPLVNTMDASVSTVIDQSYVQNMPLNGRSFQDLILLTPGVVTQASQSAGQLGGSAGGTGQTGEFAVNGQRTESNYYTVDGVSANVGSSSQADRMLMGSGTSGSVAASTALGTTQALVSVDDLQEFRVQSSTYSAESGRNPGGQFAFQTKSGTNQWHGSAYDYLRNGVFDAPDWFNNFYNQPQATLRQNDFGGTVGGPLTIPHLYNGKDKTFFFVSYEGLRLTVPQPVVTANVPDTAIRASTSGVLNQILNGWPLQSPQGTDDVANGIAQFIGTWSNPSSLDSFSVRLDHTVTDKLRLFFRFADTASNADTRGGGTSFSPSMNNIADFTLRTYTAGATVLLSSRVSNDFRLNHTSNQTDGTLVSDSFGGAVPVDLQQLAGLPPESFTGVNLVIGPYIASLFQQHQSSAQHQWNIVDTISYSAGRHQFKSGVDYRRLTPFSLQSNPQFSWRYDSPNSVQTDNADFILVQNIAPAHPLYKNFSAFVQDEWRVAQRVTLSLGLRWEVNQRRA